MRLVSTYAMWQNATQTVYSYTATIYQARLAVNMFERLPWTGQRR